MQTLSAAARSRIVAEVRPVPASGGPMDVRKLACRFGGLIFVVAALQWALAAAALAQTDTVAAFYRGCTVQASAHASCSACRTDSAVIRSSYCLEKPGKDIVGNTRHDPDEATREQAGDNHKRQDTDGAHHHGPERFRNVLECMQAALEEPDDKHDHRRQRDYPDHDLPRRQTSPRYIESGLDLIPGPDPQPFDRTQDPCHSLQDDLNQLMDSVIHGSLLRKLPENRAET